MKYRSRSRSRSRRRGNRSRGRGGNSMLSYFVNRGGIRL